MPHNIAWILLAALVQIALTIVVYIVLVRARIAGVKSGEVKASQYELVEGEPRKLALVTNHLRNQFELPVLFFALVAFLIAINRVTMIDVILAWAFVVLRVLHSAAALKADNVAMRMRFFGIGLLCVAALAVHLLIIVLGEMAL